MTQKIHHGKVALISGGLGDIASAIATTLAGQGADLALCDLHPADRAQPKLESLRELGVRVDYTEVDVSDPGAVKRWVADVAGRFGVPSLIVPNAAITGYYATLSTTPEAFEQHLRINLLGSFFMAQEAARILVEKKLPGRIVFIGSWAAHASHPQILPYSASKAALRMVAQCMALELAPHGILVNEIAPGFVDAGLSAKEFDQVPGSREECRKQVPTKKLLSPLDVAKKVCFLCHPDADELTGIHLIVDSGLTLVTPGYLPAPA